MKAQKSLKTKSGFFTASALKKCWYDCYQVGAYVVELKYKFTGNYCVVFLRRGKHISTTNFSVLSAARSWFKIEKKRLIELVATQQLEKK
jgi:hypothetical protein